jgi:hypothetical protein
MAHLLADLLRPGAGTLRQQRWNGHRGRDIRSDRYSAAGRTSLATNG